MGQSAGAGLRAAARSQLGCMARARTQCAVQQQSPQLPVVHGLHERHHQRFRQSPLRFGAPDHGSRDAADVVSSALRFNKKLAGDIYDMQTAIYEYPNFILNYEACNYNGHGLGGRTPVCAITVCAVRKTGLTAWRSRNGRGIVRRPFGDGTLPRTKFRPRAAGWYAARVNVEAADGKIQVNEDEPTPIHTKNFVDFVRPARTRSPISKWVSAPPPSPASATLPIGREETQVGR